MSNSEVKVAKLISYQLRHFDFTVWNKYPTDLKDILAMYTRGQGLLTFQC